MTRYLAPPPLRPGDAVGVIAPAGVPDVPSLRAGLALLRERFDVRLARDLATARWGMHAGTDVERAEELRWALSAPGLRAVIAARGGYGTARVLDAVKREIAALPSAPRWVVGFSDLTALHAALLRHARLQTIHGTMVCQVGRRGNPALEPLAALLESGAPQPAKDLRPLVAGRASGPLLGGNLTVLTHLIGTPWMPDLRGAVLFVEDVGERPYRLDRCLQHLHQSGAIDGLAGLVVGDLTDCEPLGEEAPAEEIFRLFGQAHGLPTAIGLQAGHGPINRPLLLGAEVTLDADAGALQWRSG